MGGQRSVNALDVLSINTECPSVANRIVTPPEPRSDVPHAGRHCAHWHAAQTGYRLYVNFIMDTGSTVLSHRESPETERERNNSIGAPVTHKPQLYGYSFTSSHPFIASHCPSPRSPVQDDCEQIEAVPTLTPSCSMPLSRLLSLLLTLDSDDQL